MQLLLSRRASFLPSFLHFITEMRFMCCMTQGHAFVFVQMLLLTLLSQVCLGLRQGTTRYQMVFWDTTWQFFYCTSYKCYHTIHWSIKPRASPFLPFLQWWIIQIISLWREALPSMRITLKTSLISLPKTSAYSPTLLIAVRWFWSVCFPGDVAQNEGTGVRTWAFCTNVRTSLTSCTSAPYLLALRRHF